MLAALPFVLAGAFTLGSPDPGGRSLVDVATASAANFALFSVFVTATFMDIVLVALFFGDTVASEANWSSLRYLLAVPVPRGRLLGVKAAVAGLLTAAPCSCCPWWPSGSAPCSTAPTRCGPRSTARCRRDRRSVGSH